jgi:hypothetical protein
VAERRLDVVEIKSRSLAVLDQQGYEDWGFGLGEPERNRVSVLIEAKILLRKATNELVAVLDRKVQGAITERLSRDG